MNLKEAQRNKIKSKDIFEIVYEYASNLFWSNPEP